MSAKTKTAYMKRNYFKKNLITELSKYPELDKIAKTVAIKTCKEINKCVRDVKSEMPYKAQYVLEETIKILEKLV